MQPRPASLAALVLLAGCFQAEAPRIPAPAPPAPPAQAEPGPAELQRMAAHAPAPAARRDAVHALADRGPSGSQTRALEQLLLDEDPRVREAAIESLADSEDPLAAYALAAALNDPEPRNRLEAVEGLADLGGPVAAMALRQALADPDAEVRGTAAEMLGELAAERR